MNNLDASLEKFKALMTQQLQRVEQIKSDEDNLINKLNRFKKIQRILDK